MLLKISACILTHNEEKNIERCLASVSFCDQVLVVDSHSTDLTREIAKSLGVDVIERDWPGFRSQREFTIAAAQHDWILFLDADEELTADAAVKIQSLRDSGRLDQVDGYWLPRLNKYYGKYVKHGDWRSDRGLRLFDRRLARVAGREIHEHVESDGTTASLDATILHESYADIHDQLQKLSGYARLMAEALHREGRRTNPLACLVNPAWRFLRSYVFRLGFLDGWRGYVIALAEAHYVLEKYLTLIALNEGENATQRDPDVTPLLSRESEKSLFRRGEEDYRECDGSS